MVYTGTHDNQTLLGFCESRFGVEGEDAAELADAVLRRALASAADVAEAKKALDGTDVDAIRAAGDKLQEVGHKLAEVVYSATQDEAAQGGAGAQGGSANDVVDADYEVVDDDKNN